MNTERVRTFVAVELPPEVRDVLAQASGLLSTGLAGAKFVSAKDLHVTLKFLGYLSAGDLDALKVQLGSVARSTEPFEMRLGSLGAFPSMRSARVVWAGISRGKLEVSQLAEKVEDACQEAGFSRSEQRFHPHVTLARLKARMKLPDDPAVVRKLKELSDHPFKVEHITLMKSELRPGGPIYSPLAVISFQKEGDLST